MSKDHGGHLAWLRLNAYGVLVACLCVLALTDLFHPAGSDLARLIGDVPPGQPVWVTGFGVAGFMLLIGFIRTDRIAETIALVLLTAGLLAQTIAAYFYLGFTEFTTTRVLLVVIIGLVGWARASVLWSKSGLSIRIPGRGEAEEQ